ncbi:ectonucleoside triphosphate diphosphohydrolase I [Legionella beliardensis]|uniref:Ectonucleoside triphosphate diphosphohydrolase I n=1 Tax=Legionella beliardensis TaxID=91822 RepID=A0A378HZR5_9GAMM|nr:multidrug DMT transporter permease [Legionella beliardensis]STX28419.1 ectonucleoside triphosphate diphosphohydrolase I [Legionella beliardensis]
MYHTRTNDLPGSIMRLALTFCLSSLICISSVNAASTAGCEQQQCVIVVDVGSTGSRMHLYSYDLDKTNSPVKITERFNKKIKPGFATIEPNQATIDAYLTTLFAGAPNVQVPVYFYATAGMRLLPQAKQQQFYSLVDQWFQTNSTWQLAAAKTISGNDEGLYGWLALNYKLNNLAIKKPKPMGYMDMGGASVEVVFPVNNTVRSDNKDVKTITLYGKNFKIFSHSFLGLGQTEVTHQFLDTDSCFSRDYDMPTGDKAQGDAYSCKNEVSSLMNAVHHVNQVIQPLLSASRVNKWYATGGLTELVKTPPFSFSTAFTSQELLDQANSAVCNQSWQDLSNQYANNDYLYGYCLFPSYYYALMVDGYGIESNTQVNYLPPGQEADWTLGVVLQQKTT